MNSSSSVSPQVTSPPSPISSQSRRQCPSMSRTRARFPSTSMHLPRILWRLAYPDGNLYYRLNGHASRYPLLPLYDLNRPKSRAAVNWGLILLNVLVFFYEVQHTKDFTSPLTETFFVQYGVVPSQIISALKGTQLLRLYPLLTSMFLHAVVVHIFGNMLFLFF